ncbi:hypothetical protein CCP3SC1_110015 [Gammaproteobacteria bacterium]
MDRIGLLGWVLSFLIGLMPLANTVMADEMAPLPHGVPSDLDPRWIHRLPPATLSLPKTSDYQEISQVSPNVQTSEPGAVTVQSEHSEQRAESGNVPPPALIPTVAPLAIPPVQPTEAKPETPTQRTRPGNTPPPLFPLSLAPMVSQHKPFEVAPTFQHEAQPTPESNPPQVVKERVKKEVRVPAAEVTTPYATQPTPELFPPPVVGKERVAERPRIVETDATSPQVKSAPELVAPLVGNKRVKKGRSRISAAPPPLPLTPPLPPVPQEDRGQTLATACTGNVKRILTGKTGKTLWQVQLMEGRDIEQLKEYRQSLISRYGDLVHDYEPVMGMDESNGGHFHLHLRPMAKEVMVQNWCATLKERGGDCPVFKKTRVVSSNSWQLQIVAERDLAGTKAYRRHLVTQYADLLKDYKLVVTINESGEFFRLRLRSIPDEATARTLCLTLKEKGHNCLVIKSIYSQSRARSLAGASNRLCTTTDKKPEDELSHP